MFQLYMVCAEKIMGLTMSHNQDIASISIQIFKGLARVTRKYQRMMHESDKTLKTAQAELVQN